MTELNVKSLESHIKSPELHVDSSELHVDSSELHVESSELHVESSELHVEFLEFLESFDKTKNLDKTINTLQATSHYQSLLEKLENKEKTLLNDLSEHITCCKGCSDCCILESLLPVEAAFVYQALLKTNIKNPNIGSTSTSESPINNEKINLDESENGQINNKNNTPCPLLVKKMCIIYKNRPIICRTHGYPIIFDGFMDYCPLNFKGLESLGFQYFLNLDVINQALSGINTLFLKEINAEKFNTADLRIPIAEILKFACKKLR